MPGTWGSGNKQVIPLTHHASATLTQAAAVQNTWYDILATTLNARIYYLSVSMRTLAEDLEVQLIIDGNTYAGSQAAAVADADYYCYLVAYGSTTATSLAMTQNTLTLVGLNTFLEGKSIRVRVRKTSANGANSLNGIVAYGTW